jgi:hypothetical protein
MTQVLQHVSYMKDHHQELGLNKRPEKVAAPSPPRPAFVPPKSPAKSPLSSSPTAKPAQSTSALPASVSSLHEDVAMKEEMKYNPELERMAKNWINNVLMWAEKLYVVSIIRMERRMTLFSVDTGARLLLVLIQLLFPL